MKIRKGFVSNSSSSSFILKTAEDKLIAEENKLEAFSVQELILLYIEIKRRINSITSLFQFIPDFLSEDLDLGLWEVESTIQELENLEKQTPGCLITKAFDRDLACGLDFNFEIYRGDL